MKIEKVGKFEVNLHDNKECVIHRRNLKQALNYGLVLKKVYKAINFSQKAWPNPCTDMTK